MYLNVYFCLKAIECLAMSKADWLMIATEVHCMQIILAIHLVAMGTIDVH